MERARIEPLVHHCDRQLLIYGEGAMTESTAQRFLKAFNMIERELKTRSGADQFIGFADALRRVAESDPAVRRMRDDLREYAELRNAIVHDRLGADRPIAEPHEKTVEKIEHLHQTLVQPPAIIPAFQKDVATTSLDERVGVPARKMLEGDFSQLPVMANGELHGLLTAETIARWLADQLTDIDLVQEATVEVVLEYTEEQDNHALLGRSASVFEALDAFDRYSSAGRTLDAILISQNGTRTERLLGIITIYDMPRLIAAAS